MTHFPSIAWRIGGHPALDLVNTVGPRVPNEQQIGSWREALTTIHDLLTWAHLAGLVDDVEKREVLAAWDDDIEADAILNAAKEIREALYRVLLTIMGVTSKYLRDSTSALDILHTRWIAATGRTKLQFEDVEGKSVAPRLFVGTAPAYVIVDRAAIAAYDLLFDADLTRLRQCPPEEGGCGWLFLDRSRNRTRRWCQMIDCGTTRKTRRRAQRTQDALPEHNPHGFWQP